MRKNLVDKKRENDAKFIQDELQRIKGLRVWDVQVGIGSFVTMQFGNVQRTGLTGRKYGEFLLWIYGCAWRIENQDSFIIGSADDKEIMTQISDYLNNTSVQEVVFDQSNFDTILKFTNNIQLSMFGMSSDMEHWLLYTPERMVISVGPKFDSIIESSTAGES